MKKKMPKKKKKHLVTLADISVSIAYLREDVQDLATSLSSQNTHAIEYRLNELQRSINELMGAGPRNIVVSRGGLITVEMDKP